MDRGSLEHAQSGPLLPADDVDLPTPHNIPTILEEEQEDAASPALHDTSASERLDDSLPTSGISPNASAYSASGSEALVDSLASSPVSAKSRQSSEVCQRGCDVSSLFPRIVRSI